MDGLFNIYKEAGMTSFDVVAKMRKILNTKTIGHTGTLDPNATGVLLVAVGRATKIIEYMEKDDKVYNAELTLGIKTDTEDIWGNILEENDFNSDLLNEETIKNTIKSFIGLQTQIPPMYSALKVNGKKLYELAREGKEIERKGREIEIFDISNIIIEENKVKFTVWCSKGTYIRTLCKDIGDKLGIGATMSKLERTKVGIFTKETSIKLSDIEKDPEKYIIDLESIIGKFPIFQPIGKDAEKYVNGINLTNYSLNDGLYRIYIENKLYGICKVDNGTVKHAKKI